MSASPETPSKKAYSSHYADLKLQNTPLMQFQKFHQHDPSPASTFANTISTKSFPPTPNEAGQNCKAYLSTALSSIIIRSSRVSFFMPYINILQWSMYQMHIWRHPCPTLRPWTTTTINMNLNGSMPGIRRMKGKSFRRIYSIVNLPVVMNSPLPNCFHRQKTAIDIEILLRVHLGGEKRRIYARFQTMSLIPSWAKSLMFLMEWKAWAFQAHKPGTSQAKTSSIREKTELASSFLPTQPKLCCLQTRVFL